MSLQLCVRSGLFSPCGNFSARQEQLVQNLLVCEEASSSLAAWCTPFAHPAAVTQGKTLQGAAVRLTQARCSGDVRV